MPLDALPAPPAGYASLDYARTLAHAGDPWPVAAWGTSVLLRPIPNAPGALDAMGPYPVCSLVSGADIPAGLAALRSARAVSVVLVADPLAGVGPAALSRHFPLCRPFKTHYLVDRDAGPVTLSKHHRDRIRRGERWAAARLVPFEQPVWRDTWCRLYAELIARHALTGVHAFPAAAFDTLAVLPPGTLVAFAAETPDGDVLAMQLWIRCGDRAYSHLTATSQAGYRVGATYVVYATAIKHFADCRVLDLGGGAGTADDLEDTLATFKRGFANASTVAHLCGAVLDDAAYRRLAHGCETAYFPAYR